MPHQGVLVATNHKLWTAKRPRLRRTITNSFRSPSYKKSKPQRKIRLPRHAIPSCSTRKTAAVFTILSARRGNCSAALKGNEDRLIDPFVLSVVENSGVHPSRITTPTCTQGQTIILSLRQSSAVRRDHRLAPTEGERTRSCKWG